VINPVEGASIPRQPQGETRFLSVGEVERMAEAIRPPYEVLVYTVPQPIAFSGALPAGV
jgi:hypothetical protein